MPAGRQFAKPWVAVILAVCAVALGREPKARVSTSRASQPFEEKALPVKFAYRPNPQLYEINAWSWLDQLSRQAGRRITLGEVPDSEWDRMRALWIRFRVVDGPVEAKRGRAEDLPQRSAVLQDVR